MPIMETSDKKDSGNKSWSWLDFAKLILQFFGKNRYKFLLAATIIFLTYFYTLIPPVAIGLVVDFFTKYQPGEPIDFVIFVAAGFMLTNLVFSQVRLRSREWIGNLFSEMNYRVKVDGFTRLMEYSLAWHEKENAGNKIQRLQSGIESLSRLGDLLTSGGSGLLMTVAGIVGVIGAFLFLSPVFMLFGIAFVVVFFAIHRSYENKIQKVNALRNQQLEKVSGRFYEGLNNVLTIKSLGAKDSFVSQVNEAESTGKNYEVERRKYYFTKRRWFQGVISVANAAFILLLANQYLAGVITVGVIIVYFNYLGRLIDITWEATEVLDNLQLVKQGVERLAPVFKDENIAVHGDKSFPAHWKQIQLLNAGFKYQVDSKQFAVKNLDLVIRKGEKLGIVGRSGSGKSTLVKLLLGLYPLSEGSYQIGGVNFYELGRQGISSNIAIVLQDAELFNASLADNLTLLQKPVMSKLLQAIKIAQLEDLVKRLPEGINSLIGEKGYKLSGGERQRLGIARAIYRDTDILFLDEATSNLDSATELAVQHALESELKSKTMVIVAHRLSTLRNVDRIVVFEDGSIVETGSFDELIANKSGRFHQLYSLQVKKGEKL